MSGPDTNYHVFNLFDWTKGIHDRVINPLNPVNSSLFAGENIDVTNTGLEVRDGSKLLSSLDGAAPVVHLATVRFPTTKMSYLIAQTINSSGVGKLFAAPLPFNLADTISWTEIYHLGAGANVTSVSALNDRAILTEGHACPPLVFGGCLDPAGQDWALPMAVLCAQNNGTDWSDISDTVLDTDSESVAEIGNISSGASWIAICLDTPVVTGLFFDLGEPNTLGGNLILEAYSRGWTPIANIADTTHGLSRTGVVTWTSTLAPLSATIINNIEGFWVRIRLSNGTNPGFAINRILFQAPCQPLSCIGSGLPDAPVGFIYWDESAHCAKDFTIEVQDFTYPSFARLNDAGLENPQGMTPQDFIYVGYLTRFHSIELTPHNDYHNSNTSNLSGSYWNGTDWVAFTGFSDGCAEPAGATLSKKGIISWDRPDDWRPNRPIGSQYPYGYWIRLSVSANLTAKTLVSEAAVWPEFDPIKKHDFVITVRDRVILCGRSDSPDQMQISRSLEEYGFCGPDSATLRIGGAGEIVAAIEVFNQGFIAKTDDWYLLNGYSPETFSVERAEAAGQAPVNNRVLVRAPHTEADSKNLMGLYYINQRGAWHFAGLKVYQISDQVSWWDRSSNGLRLDLNNLESACGIYWAPRNWIIWSVPMLSNMAEQRTNNRLIVYDLGLKSWLPPFTISACSMTTFSLASALESGSGTALLAGDYHGRVLELFGSDSHCDETTPVQAWAETPWNHFGSPNIEKSLRILTACSSLASQSPLHVDVFTDGNRLHERSVEFTKLTASDDRSFAIEQKPLDVHGRFFKFRVHLTGASKLYGLQAGIYGIREWGAM